MMFVCVLFAFGVVVEHVGVDFFVSVGLLSGG